jgi:hypothetical protein
MPRTAVPINTLSGNVNGVLRVAPTAGDVANGNVINSYNEHTWLEVTNTHATVAGTVTFNTPSTVGGRAVGDDVGSVAAGGTVTRMFGPWDKDIFGENLEFNVSAATMTVVAYQTALA